jgi:uncharacterized membrane protein
MKYVRAFGRFWWDFIVGDDWRVAVGVAIGLGLTALLAHHGVNAWWLLPPVVALVLAASLWRAVPRASRRPRPVSLRNPALVEHARERSRSFENRVADRITAFSGSMRFVYLHAVWFACWIGFGVEAFPYGLLTMIVSLEAIFLSTFLLISQNRADAKREVLADQQWATVQKEDGQNEELLELTRQILERLDAGRNGDPLAHRQKEAR